MYNYGSPFSAASFTFTLFLLFIAEREYISRDCEGNYIDADQGSILTLA
jgi:hypothetical protein